MLWGPDSMVPQPQDIIDIWRNFKWFVGKGPQPKFDRWTYWEKFDYWAVFWGMFIIGGSGLLLWFPVFFSKLLPGWMFNIAALVHGEEALLAVGFIFTFHFFNGHLRPQKFPMDTVVFTGRISEHELKDERLVEYERMVREGHAGRPGNDAALRGGQVVRLDRRRHRAGPRHRRDRADRFQCVVAILPRDGASGPVTRQREAGPHAGPLSCAATVRRTAR